MPDSEFEAMKRDFEIFPSSYFVGQEKLTSGNSDVPNGFFRTLNEITLKQPSDQAAPMGAAPVAVVQAEDTSTGGSREADDALIAGEPRKRGQELEPFILSGPTPPRAAGA